MVAHLVRLKLTLLAAALKRSVWQVVGTVLGLLGALGTLALVVVGLGALAFADPQVRTTVLVLGGGLAVLGWWLVPLVAFGTDETLEPRRFALFPVPPRTLATGLALASLVGIPGVATAVCALASAGVWWDRPVALLPGVLGAVLGLATCVVGSRFLTTALLPLVTARRFRELLAVVLIAPLVLLGPIVQGLGTSIERSAEVLPRVADVVAWTPVGAPWSLGADAAAGRWGPFAGRLLVAVVTVALLGLGWQRALQRALVRPGGSRSVTRASGLGLLGRMPGDPVGAVAARALVYWFRDPRYAAGAVVVPLLPVVMWFGSGGSDVMLVVGPMTAFLVGWTISADVAYDHTAFWMHAASTIRGWQDRAGRVLAATVLGLPASLVLAVGSLWVTGRWDATVVVLAGTVGVLAGSLGVASVASTMFIHPVPKPGESPFATPQGGSGLMMLGQFGGSLVVLALLSPALVLGVVAVVQGGAAVTTASVATSLLLGGALLVLGVRIGGSIYDRSPARLLARVVAND